MLKREPNFQDLFKEEGNENADTVENNEQENENEEQIEETEEEEYEVYEDYPSFFEYLQIEATRFKDKITGLLPSFTREEEYEYIEEDYEDYEDNEDDEDESDVTYEDNNIEEGEYTPTNKQPFTVDNSNSSYEEIIEDNEGDEDSEEDNDCNDTYVKVVKSDIDSKIKYNLDSEVCKYYIRIYRVILCIIASTLFIVCNLLATSNFKQEPTMNIKKGEVDYIYVGNKPLCASPLGSYYINYPTKSIGTIQRYYALDMLCQKYKLNITKEDVINDLNKYSFIAKQSKLDKEDLIAQTKYDLILNKLVEKKLDEVKIPKDMELKLKANDPTYKLSVKAYKCKDIKEGRALISKDNIPYNQSFQFSSKDTTFAELVKMLVVSDYGVVKEPVKLGNGCYIIEYIKKEIISDDDTEQYKKEQAKLKVFAEMREITDKYPIHYTVDKETKKKNKK